MNWEEIKVLMGALLIALAIGALLWLTIPMLSPR